MALRGFVTGVVAVVGLAGCAAGAPDPAEPEPRPSAGVYAYLTVTFGSSVYDTESEMHLMDGTAELGTSGPMVLASAPVFTTDGRYVVTLPAFVDEFVAISVDSGEATRVPCAGCGDRLTECQSCPFLVPVGGSEVAWLDGPANELVRLDLAAGEPTPERTGLTVPTEPGFLDEQRIPNLIGGTDGAVVASYQGILPGDDLLPAYLMTLEGERRRIAADRPDAIELAVFSPDGSQVALAGNQEYVCASVTVADVATGTGPTVPVAAEPGTACENHDVYVESLWWDDPETLNVVFEVDEDHSTAKNTQRRFSDGRFVETGAAEGTEVRALSAGTATIEGAAPGTLYVEADGERTKIATDVRYLTAAPPE